MILPETTIDIGATENHGKQCAFKGIDTVNAGLGHKEKYPVVSDTLRPFRFIVF